MKEKMVYLIAPKASTFIRAYTSLEAAEADIETAKLFDVTIDHAIFPIEVSNGKARKPRKPREPKAPAA